MNEPTHTFSGHCHCGAISMELAFTQDAEEMQVRSCQCDFCIRQGSLTVSEAAGRAVITVEADQLTTHSFGSQTAQFLICSRCGVYAGAIMADGDELLSIANARGLGIEAFSHRLGTQMTHDDETTPDRIDRRRQRWTPTEINFKL